MVVPAVPISLALSIRGDSLLLFARIFRRRPSTSPPSFESISDWSNRAVQR
jgi:hypothetical protein